MSFLIADGVQPSNEGRGYVLRRIMRRAIRHGFMLGQRKPFFHSLVATLEQEMGAAYPELHAQRTHIERVIRQEEERFAETLTQGMALLDDAIGKMRGKEIPGETVFRLYDTYGFPVDLTNDIAREQGLTLDEAGFETAMDAQRARARAASKFGVDLRGDMQVEGRTLFEGYESERGEGKVVALFRGREAVTELRAGEEGQVVLDATPFYAESGGQVGDQGELAASGARFVVTDTQKLGNAHVHVGKLESGTLRVGDALTATVDSERRQATRLNHSATHLLHAALRKVLGTHVLQKGSLVAPDRLRFDFSHYSAVTPEELHEIESIVNAQVRANAAAETKADEVRRGRRVGRDGVVRREIRRRRARAEDRRLLDRALRRHARGSRGRHRSVQDRQRRRRGRGHPPHRGRDGRAARTTTWSRRTTRCARSRGSCAVRATTWKTR